MEMDHRKWHVGKEIPLAMIFTLIIQTCTVVWWAAGINSKLEFLTYQVAEFKSDRYTASDARRDIALLNQRIDSGDRRCEDALDQIQAGLRPRQQADQERRP